MIVRDTLTIDLGTYEWDVTKTMDGGRLDLPTENTREVTDRIKKILGHKDLNVLRVRVKVPDVCSPSVWLHLGAVLHVLDAWGIEKELIFE